MGELLAVRFLDNALHLQKELVLGTLQLPIALLLYEPRLPLASAHFHLVLLSKRTLTE